MLTASSHPCNPASKGDLRKRHLSDARQRLVVLLQRVGFGAVHNLVVRSGEPVLDPPPLVRVRRKNGSVSPSRPSATTADFALKREWVDFFRDLDGIGDGVVQLIEVAHGLPIIHEFDTVISV